LQRAQAAFSIANKAGQAYAIAMAHFFLTDLLVLLRDLAATLRESNLAISSCEKHGFALWLGQASLHHGWALAMQGHVDEGIKEMETAFANGGYWVVQSRNWPMRTYLPGKRPRVCAPLSRACSLRESVRKEHGRGTPSIKGRTLVQRAEGKGAKHGEDIELAEHCFSTAIKRARDNDAKSFELRAAMSRSISSPSG
jgi:hypothetical protein